MKKFIKALSVFLALGVVAQAIVGHASDLRESSPQKNVSKIRILLNEQKSKIENSEDYDDTTKEDLIAIIKKLEILTIIEKSEPGP